MKIKNTIWRAALLGFVSSAWLYAAAQTSPAVSDPAEIDELVAAITGFAERHPQIFGKVKLEEEEKQALKTAIENGTKLLEKTSSVEQKYWAAEVLIKSRLTLARVQPLNTLTELQKIEEWIAVLEKKPGEVAILPMAKQQILKHSILLLTKPGDDLPNPYRVKEAVKKHVTENPKDRDFFTNLLIDAAIQNISKDRQFAIETLKDVVELYKMSEFLDDRNYVKKLQEMLKRFELIGNPAPFSGADLAGNIVSSNDFKNKIILIDFWATWCAPCVASLPEMKRLHETYHKRGFEIVGVNIDKNKDALEKFLEEKKLPWKIISDTVTEEKGGKRLAEHFGISEYPTLMLIGRDGNVIATDFDLKTLERELVKQFNNNSTKPKPTAILTPLERTPTTPSLL